MSLEGIPASGGQPWIFVSMLRMPTGEFVPVPGPTLDGPQQMAQMLKPAGPQRVIPMPHANNLAPVTCGSNARGVSTVPIEGRIGASTATIFADPRADQAKVRLVTELIADPSKSHFFNTDCVSCHTETRAAINARVLDASGLDASVLPQQDYTVRNFGWAPVEDGGNAVVTRRTANETAAVVKFVNETVLGH